VIFLARYFTHFFYRTLVTSDNKQTVCTSLTEENMANQIYPAWGMWLKDRESVLQWVNLHSIGRH
jgi:hypothetical protein